MYIQFCASILYRDNTKTFLFLELYFDEKIGTPKREMLGVLETQFATMIKKYSVTEKSLVDTIYRLIACIIDRYFLYACVYLRFCFIAKKSCII